MIQITLQQQEQPNKIQTAPQVSVTTTQAVHYIMMMLNLQFMVQTVVQDIFQMTILPNIILEENLETLKQSVGRFI